MVEDEQITLLVCKKLLAGRILASVFLTLSAAREHAECERILSYFKVKEDIKNIFLKGFQF
jgi:hypothetical protein